MGTALDRKNIFIEDLPDDGYRDREVRLKTLLGGAGRLAGDLSAECAALLATVFEAFGKNVGPGDFRGPGQRNHDALEAALRLALGIPGIPQSAGMPSRVLAMLSLAAIVTLYDELARIQDTPVVSLNRAVAVAMRDGPAAGIALLDPLTREPVLAGSHRVWAVRADLHRRAGHHARAADDYDRALHLVTNDAERRYLAAARSSLPHDQARQPGKD